MDEEEFVRTMFYSLYYDNRVPADGEDVIYEIAEQFYEDFVESSGVIFGEQPILWTEDLAKRIVDEELAAMEYE